MEQITCNLCGNSTTTELYRFNNQPVVMCTQCSLVFLNPRLTAAEYVRHYTDSYQDVRHKITSLSQAVARLEAKGSYKQKQDRLQFFAGFINEHTKILEIGSGWGTFLKVLQDTYHCPVVGIEISALAAEVATKYYGLPIIQKPLEEYVAAIRGTETFDVIIMHHVLEHLLDPKVALSQIKSIMHENSYLYIAVPNVAAPDELLNTFFRLEHCYYFSPSTLARLLQDSGFLISKTYLDGKDMKMIVKKGNNHHQEQLPSGPTPVELMSLIKKRQQQEEIKQRVRAGAERLLGQKNFRILQKIIHSLGL